MNDILSILQRSGIVEPALNAMFHSLWIFSIIALGVFFIFIKMPDLKSAARYRIALMGVITSFVIFFIIFEINYADTNNQNHSESITFFTAEKNLIQEENTESGIFLYFSKESLIFWWLAGVLVLLLKNILSLGFIYHLGIKKNSIKYFVSDEIIKTMAAAFNIKKVPEIKEAFYKGSPITFGWLKPVILFPVGLVNHLTVREAEAVIAHELAHISRNDFVINIFIEFIHTFFYYHPAIWWLLSVIREERENICDEMALAYTGNRISYALVLIKIHEWQAEEVLQPAISFNQPKYFTHRIKKILNMNTTRNFLTGKFIGTAIIVTGILFFTIHLAGNNIQSKNGNITADKKSYLNEPQILADTVPSIRRENIVIQKKSDDKEVKISLENGQIKELIVDGKKIEETDYDQYQELIDELKPGKGKGGSSMYFFDSDDANGSMFFNFRNFDSMDSLTGKEFVFPFGTDREDMMPFGFNKDEHRKMMEEIRKEMETMKFDLKLDFDEMPGWDMKEFSMPEMDKLMERFRKEGMEFRFYSPDSGMGEEEPDGGFSNDWNSESKDVNDVLGDALNRDGFLIPGKMNKVELTGKHLKINGEKQPSNIYNKYKRIVEEVVGTEMSKNSKLEFSIMGKESKRKYRVF